MLTLLDFRTENQNNVIITPTISLCQNCSILFVVDPGGANKKCENLAHPRYKFDMQSICFDSDIRSTCLRECAEGQFLHILTRPRSACTVWTGSARTKVFCLLLYTITKPLTRRSSKGFSVLLLKL